MNMRPGESAEMLIWYHSIAERRARLDSTRHTRIAVGVAWLVVFVLGIAACGPVRPVAVMPAPTIHAETVSVVEAINAAAGERLVAIGVDPGATIWLREACGTFDGREATVAACGSDRSYVTAGIAHELGHAFGLRHSRDPASVMYASSHAMTTEDAARSLVEEIRR